MHQKNREYSLHVSVCLSVCVCVKREKEKGGTNWWNKTWLLLWRCPVEEDHLSCAQRPNHNSRVLPTTHSSQRKNIFSRPSHLVCQFWCRRCLSRAFDTATLTEWFVKKKNKKERNCEIVCQKKQTRQILKRRKKDTSHRVCQLGFIVAVNKFMDTTPLRPSRFLSLLSPWWWCSGAGRDQFFGDTNHHFFLFSPLVLFIFTAPQFRSFWCDTRRQ